MTAADQTKNRTNVASAVTSASNFSETAESPVLRVHKWDKKSRFSDFIKAGLSAQNKDDSHVVMLFDSPSSCNPNATFYNSQRFLFHDWPIVATGKGKSLIGPCRYAMMVRHTFGCLCRP
jgi:hypothetical protein